MRKKRLQIFLSYCHKDSNEADEIYKYLSSSEEINIIRDIIDLRPFESLDKFMDEIRRADLVIMLISRHYLQSINCMKELIKFRKEDVAFFRHYMDRMIVLFLPDVLVNEHNILTFDGSLHYVTYWLEKKSTADEKVKERIKKYGEDLSLHKFREEVFLYEKIADNLSDFLAVLRNFYFSIPFEFAKKHNYEPVLQKIKEKTSLPILIEARRRVTQLEQSIKVPSINDPKKPEFPPDNPHFPATKTYLIKIPGFGEVLLKDESSNPTGTHKDRMAWEVVVFYKKILSAQSIGQLPIRLPQCSLISSGPAAYAVQTMLRKYLLPDLKVLLDYRTPIEIKQALLSVGCELYGTDLQQQECDSTHTLEMTENIHGLDLTERNLMDPNALIYYDWMSYEILNNNPEYVFMPFGTGDPFNNVLSIATFELLADNPDPRFQGRKKDVLRKCNYLGATTNNPNSKLDKLYSAYRSQLKHIQRNIQKSLALNFCGSRTSIIEVEEEFVDDAIDFASQNGIECEPSGAAGLALFLQLKNTIPKGSRVLIVNTGKLKFMR